MASLLGNLKTIAPCLGFRLVYPILTMMFAGTHRTFLGLGVSRVEADFLFGRGYMLYPTDIFFAASVMAGAWVLTGFARNLLAPSRWGQRLSIDTSGRHNFARNGGICRTQGRAVT